MLKFSIEIRPALPEDVTGERGEGGRRGEETEGNGEGGKRGDGEEMEMR